MPLKGSKKLKKGNSKEATRVSQKESRVQRERTQLEINMRNFNQPSIRESLASQGMMLRGRTIRAGQGDSREGVYTKLIGLDKNKEKKEKEIPPQPPPLDDRDVSLSLPPHPVPKQPLERNPQKTPPPPSFSDSAEMSTDDYNKVNGQLKQVAIKRRI